MNTEINFSEISKTETNSLTEENVKIRIVLEILKKLGYSGNDLLMEHSFGTDRPDIIINGVMPIIIEVKGSNENINNHITQIERYSYNFRSFISILTNGAVFYIFNPFWKRKSFFDTLIYSFKLSDINSKRTKEILVNILSKKTNFRDKELFINELENEILNKERRRNELENEIDSLKQQIKNIERSFSNIDLEQLQKAYNYLNDETKQLINKLKELNSSLEKLNKEKSKLNLFKSDSNKNLIIASPKKILRNEITEDFRMGISDEIVNFNALCNGHQITLCKGMKKSNQFIFLLPKTTSESEFTLSDYGKIFSKSITDLSTQYIAHITDFLEIPGFNFNFWKELFETEEFNLWDIENGPHKYFLRKKSQLKQYLWIMRIYKLDFVLQENKDYKRGSHGNSSIINPDTLNKINFNFRNNNYKPVIDNDSFEKRVTLIKEITAKYK